MTEVRRNRSDIRGHSELHNRLKLFEGFNEKNRTLNDSVRFGAVSSQKTRDTHSQMYSQYKSREVSSRRCSVLLIARLPGKVIDHFFYVLQSLPSCVSTFVVQISRRRLLRVFFFFFLPHDDDARAREREREKSITCITHLSMHQQLFICI